MSYSPATKLSHSNATNKATVLTNGNVMVTLGLGVGQMMTLEDWRILADGATIVEERAAVPVASQPPAAPGSKFRWTLDANNYRVAIMTAKGLLEVKSVVNGETDFKKTLFPNEAAWRASLPLNDSGITELSDPLAEKTRANEEYQRLSDVEKVAALMKRYKIRDEAWDTLSPAESVRITLEHIKMLRDHLNKLTLEDDLAGKRHRLNLDLKRCLARHTVAKIRYEAAGPNAEKRPMRMCYRGPGHIYATINGDRHYLTLFNDKIAAQARTHHWSPVKLFNNFTEMGNPRIEVLYRRSTIHV